MRYNLMNNNGFENIVVYLPDDPQPLRQADSNHPNFSFIKDKVLADDESGLVELFDPAHRVAEKFSHLSDRVAVAGGHVYFDGDEVQGVLVDQIVRFLNEGVEDWRPLVAFWENLATNPSDESRDHLYLWLRTHNFTITSDGMIVGYKGVGGDYLSIHSGSAIVNGEVVNGRIPNRPGDIVEMPRSQVNASRDVACSTGLHVATWDYAKSWGPVVMEVHVNPRDAVSVPSDHKNTKWRVCRYKVIREVSTDYRVPVVDVTKATEV